MIYRNKEKLLYSQIKKGETVLDVGFWGELGRKDSDKKWPHKILGNITKNLYGVDTELEGLDAEHYHKENAENFTFPLQFDVIFAGDLIEHLSNPGLFLNSCTKNLKSDGRLLLTTPNAFCLFNLFEKLSKYEPTVNSDHTFYFNLKTLQQLLSKNGFEIVEYGYIYSLEYNQVESWKKKILNGIYWACSWFTDKFIETMYVVAKPI